MNIAKLALRQWLRTSEAAHYLTSKLNYGPYGSENGISKCDVLDFALAGHFLLTLDIPPSTTDKRGVELEGGYWDLLMKGPRGKPGRRQVKHQVDPPVSVKGIDGAWVARKIAGERVVRQLRPQAGPGGFGDAFPEGCALGVRTKALNDFVKKQLKGQTAPKSADALDKPLRPNEKEKLLTIIYALIKNAKPPIDLSEPAKAAQTLESMADLAGVTVSAKTIQRRLEEIVESIAPRDKTSD